VRASGRRQAKQKQRKVALTPMGIFAGKAIETNIFKKDFWYLLFLS